MSVCGKQRGRRWRDSSAGLEQSGGSCRVWPWLGGGGGENKGGMRQKVVQD